MDHDAHNHPVAASNDNAITGAELSGLLEQVERDHGHEGASAMSDHLRNRMAETTETLDTATGLDD